MDGTWKEVGLLTARSRRWAQGEHRVQGSDPHPKKGQLGQVNRIRPLRPSVPVVAAPLLGTPGLSHQSSLGKTRWALLYERSFTSITNEMFQPGSNSMRNMNEG